jgi:hypothetical protein
VVRVFRAAEGAEGAHHQAQIKLSVNDTCTRQWEQKAEGARPQGASAAQLWSRCAGLPNSRRRARRSLTAETTAAACLQLAP